MPLTGGDMPAKDHPCEANPLEACKDDKKNPASLQKK